MTNPANPTNAYTVPSVSITTAHTGASSKANALDKLNNQGLRQAIIVVPERSIGGSFADEPLSQYGFYWDWQVGGRYIGGFMHKR